MKLRGIIYLSIAIGLLPSVASASPPTYRATTLTTSENHAPAQVHELITKLAPRETVSQRNAKKKAASYLRFMAFSRKGLIEQLIYEGFSRKVATYGVDALKVKWKLQAKKKAKSYLSTSAFSRSGLISQLKFEGFTTKEATYGVDTNKINWKAQAVKKAQSYLEYSSFSRDELINLLMFEGFTEQQATYGVDKVGL